MWNYAAFGEKTPRLIEPSWLDQTNKIHDQSLAPASITNNGERVNVRGISDMFGNVWEWCSLFDNGYKKVSFFVSKRKIYADLKGGGYLDDLSKISPFLSSSMLEDDFMTCHSDLGFRIAVFLNTENIDSKVLNILWSSKDSLEEYFYNFYFYADFYSHLYNLDGFYDF